MWRIAAACASLWLAGTATADACSWVVEQHELDPAEQRTDRRAPGKVEATVASIVRGRASGPQGTSCDDVAIVQIELQRVEDDRTPREKLGYRLALVEGTPRPGWSVPPVTFRVRPEPGRPLRFTVAWVDGATDDQEPVDFTLAVMAVDLAGNESEPARVRISHLGSGQK